MAPVKGLLRNLYNSAVSLNEGAIVGLTEIDSEAVLLDCGCGPGDLTSRLASRITPKKIIGIEIVDEFAELARQKGVTVIKADLNKGLPVADESVTVLHANQVIEHLTNTDVFIDEIYRVLQPNGYGVISTENMASWHNIASLLFGWQPFSQTNISKARLGIGNPLALHRGEDAGQESMLHITVFAMLGLIELFEAKKFTVEKVVGSGYYPLPGIIGRIDSRHAAFVAIKIRKG